MVRRRVRSDADQISGLIAGPPAGQSVHPAIGLDTSGRPTNRWLGPGAPAAPGHPLRAASFRT